jgi:long-chain acyl-CoA synthetase
MSDLILGSDWLGPVHHLFARPFGSGPVERFTICGALARHARTQPETPFLTEIKDDATTETITYRQAYLQVRQRAALLARWGLQRGERVGVLGHNSAHFVFAVLAVLEAGGVAVLLSHHDPPARTAAHVEFTQVRFLLHDDNYTTIAQACASGERACAFREFDRQASSLRSDVRVGDSLPKPTDGALILFTSGTTGVPKAVVQSHYSVAQNAWSLTEHHHIKPGMRLLCVLPLHHVNGLEFTIFSVMLGGGHTVISRGFDGLRFWTIVREHGIHIISLVPNLLSMLADRPRWRGHDTLPVRYAVSAAAPLSVGIAQRVWERLGLRIVQGYGLSEVTNFSCLMPPGLPDLDYQRWMLRGRRTSIGPALPGQEVEIHDGERVTPPGAEGEIVIRGHCVMSGYLHDPKATEKVYQRGWFHTGDLGYYLLDDSGCKYFHVSGRLREIAKRSGIMVNLLELDEVLMSIPGVVDAGSSAFANRWVDEEIAAAIVQEPGAVLTQKTITEHCRRVLPFSAIPKAIEFVDAIPRTASGKIRRAEIARRFVNLGERLFVEGRSEAE